MRRIMAGVLFLLSANIFPQGYFGEGLSVAYRMEFPFGPDVTLIMEKREHETVTAIFHTDSPLDFSICHGEANFGEEAIEYSLSRCDGIDRRLSQNIDLREVTAFDHFEAQVEDSRFEGPLTVSFTKQTGGFHSR